jgi:hypothetical protein
MEALALVELGRRMTPVVIRHQGLGLEWAVVDLIEDWMTPRYADAVGTSGETRRFRVRVRGPLPGRPAESGEFEMAVRRYGDRPGWWISPEEALATRRCLHNGSFPDARERHRRAGPVHPELASHFYVP